MTPAMRLWDEMYKSIDKPFIDQIKKEFARKQIPLQTLFCHLLFVRKNTFVCKRHVLKDIDILSLSYPDLLRIC